MRVASRATRISTRNAISGSRSWSSARCCPENPPGRSVVHEMKLMRPVVCTIGMIT